VLRTILTSPEFLDPAAHRAKVKSPLEFVASAVRAIGADVETALPLVMTLRELGMPLYLAQPPTGYPDTASAWVNSGALVGRMNFAVALVGNKIRGVWVDLGAIGSEATRDELIVRFLPGGASQATLDTIEQARGVSTTAALIVGSPEYQRR
jgi:uncharacterized protein (DUF1800 family)